MGPDSGKENAPNNDDSSHDAREIFLGPDVVSGRELVSLLKSEGVGIPVFNIDLNKRSINHRLSGEPGKDEVVTNYIEEVPNSTLLGIVIPVGADENNTRFVYVSSTEEGFVFEAGSKKVKDFDLVDGQIYKVFNSLSFGEHVSYLQNTGGYKEQERMKFIMREAESPGEYEETVVSAVTQERNRLSENKGKRAAVRRSLLSRLF